MESEGGEDLSLVLARLVLEQLDARPGGRRRQLRRRRPGQGRAHRRGATAASWCCRRRCGSPSRTARRATSACRRRPGSSRPATSSSSTAPSRSPASSSIPITGCPSATAPTPPGRRRDRPSTCAARRSIRGSEVRRCTAPC